MKNLFISSSLFFVSLCLALPLAFAACDPHVDEACCITDVDCALYVNPALCVILPMNKTAAKKLEEAQLGPSGDCIEESVKKLKEKAKTYLPVCISYGCDFKVPGE